MIPEAAVEAAAEALCLAVWDTTWAMVNENQRHTFRSDARKALEAAAPHMANTNDDNRGEWRVVSVDAHGSASIVGEFRYEWQAEKCADRHNAADSRVSAFWERAPK